MKINKDFSLKVIEGKNYIVNNSDDSKVVIGSMSAFLFSELLTGEKSKEQLLNSLLSKFEISTVLALNEIDKFVKTLKQNGIIEE